jgi:hypothetical protein
MRPDNENQGRTDSGQGRGRGPEGRGPGGRGRSWDGPRGRGQNEPVPASNDEVKGWLAGRLPATWFTSVPNVEIDRDEITIVGALDLTDIPEGIDAASAAQGRITRFREETRDERIAIAQDLERRFERSVAWGAEAGDISALFTNQAIPAMTRLRQPERQVLDTLVDAGVARSRAEALAWCVKLVGQNQEEWITSLREALNSVEQVRKAGPKYAPLNSACSVPQG